ncbi:hypothetical protein HSBAA_12340 [Vreelandella sulfidaeris]|uniref:Uncharacterized protein n=1 Tax=Vreelandella sulfidaeris TaxID=115553 RepID=A0A455U6P4_9GAMM|nr:hypothetical protein HSBAA_12340 [Halomonas sulfidaeris]
MLIKIAKPSDLHESDVTPESIYLSRRRFMGGMAGLGAGLALSGHAQANADYSDVPDGNAPAWLKEKISKTQWEAVTPSNPEKTKSPPLRTPAVITTSTSLALAKPTPPAMQEAWKPSPGAW